MVESTHIVKPFPKITVVTPSYNQGAFIERTIRSIIDQEYPELEYLVLDGGSTDETLDVIKKYEKSISYWESGKDHGQADAILRGFHQATGDIICWVNSDDILLPGSLRAVGEFFLKHPEEICLVGNALVIDARDEPIKKLRVIPSFTVASGIDHNKLLYFGCSFNQPSCFFRRTSFFDVGGFDPTLQFSFDYDLFLRLSALRPFATDRRYFSAFRMHELSKSTRIQDVCRMENELLWQRYKRDRKSLWYITLKRGIYSLENYMVKYSVLIFYFKYFSDAVNALRMGNKDVKE